MNNFIIPLNIYKKIKRKITILLNKNISLFVINIL